MSAPPRRLWRELPTTAFGEGARDWVAVLPLAAIEQHGPHLPVGVDAIIAEGMVEACIAALRPDSPGVFLPTLEIGKSNEHARFAGTLSLSWQTFTQALIELGRSVAAAGPRRLILVTSHGGNVAPMEIAARELRAQAGMLAVTTSWGRLGRWQEIYPYGNGPVTDIHGGLAETSVMAALRPDLVDMDRARNFASAQDRLATRFSKLGWHGAPANAAWLAGDLNPEGVVGDAAAARPEWGQADIAASAQGMATLIDELAVMELPE